MPVSELWTPAEITTELWLDASDSATLSLSGSDVITWADKSGNGRSPTQGTSGNRPDVVAADLNGLDVIEFDGTDDRLAFGSSNLARNVSSVLVFAVAKHDATPSSAQSIITIVRNTGTAWRVQLMGNAAGNYETGGRRLDGDSYSGVTSTATIDTGWHVRAGVFDFANSDLYQYIDGVLDGSTTSFQTSGVTSNTASLALVIGATHVPDARLDGKIAEIVVIHNDITDDTREFLDGYLHWKYGLEANLPGGHPYESAAPVVPRASPGVGAVTFSGLVPAANVSVSAHPGAGSVAFTGQTPTVAVSDNELVTVPVGAAAFTGYAPQIVVGVRVDVPIGSVLVTGYAPLAGHSANVVVGVGSALFTGMVPAANASDHKRADVPDGSVAFTGRVPLAGASVSVVPGVGSAVFTGNAPAARTPGSAAVGLGMVAFTRYAPTVSVTDNKTAAIPAGVVAMTGYAPKAGNSGAAVAAVGAVALVGYAPLVGNTGSAAPAAGAMMINGQAPVVALSNNQAAMIPAGAVAFTGRAPVPGISGSAAPPSGSAAFNGLSPALYADPPDFSGTPTPLTRARFVVLYPVIMPDGRNVMFCSETCAGSTLTLYKDRDNAVTIVPYSVYASRTNYPMGDVVRVVINADDVDSTTVGDSIEGDSDVDDTLVWWDQLGEDDDGNPLWQIYCKVGLFDGIVAGDYTLRVTLYDAEHTNGLVLPSSDSDLVVTIVDLP